MKPGIYTRDTDIRARGETSHGAQEEGCRRLAETMGFPTALAEDVLSDQGSGAGLDRPGFIELWRRIRGGIYGALFVYSPEHLSSNRMILITFIVLCKEAGVQLYFVEEHWGIFDEDALVQYVKCHYMSRRDGGRSPN